MLGILPVGPKNPDFGFMNSALTLRQQSIYDYIQEFTHSSGFPPTLREIGEHFHIAPASVLDHLRALERKGVIKRLPFKPRCIEVLKDRSKI